MIEFTRDLLELLSIFRFSGRVGLGAYSRLAHGLGYGAAAISAKLNGAPFSGR